MPRFFTVFRIHDLSLNFKGVNLVQRNCVKVGSKANSPILKGLSRCFLAVNPKYHIYEINLKRTPPFPF